MHMTNNKRNNLIPDPNILDAQIDQWHRDAMIVFHEAPLIQGAWINIIDGYLTPRVASSGGRMIQHNANLLQLNLEHAIPSLEEATQIPQHTHSVLVPSPRRLIPIKTLLMLYRKRVSYCWLHEPGGWIVEPVESLLAELLYLKTVKPIAQRLFPTLRINNQLAYRTMGNRLKMKRGMIANGDHNAVSDSTESTQSPSYQIPYAESGEDLWKAFIKQDNAQYNSPELPENKPPHVVLYIGSLSSGGAERQLCNLAIGLHKRKFDCHVRTTFEPDGEEHGHYRPLLINAGLDARGVSATPDCTTQIAKTLRWDLLAAVPECIRPYVISLAVDLAKSPPDILHCWLDHPNIMGALAGLIANVPAILLSTRNSNPTNFPRLYSPYMDIWYHIISQSKRVHWLANSHSGAASYANWIGMPTQNVHVILNGVFTDHFDKVTDDVRIAARHKFNIQPNAPVVAVINRLSEEKQPDLMLKVISMIHQDLPDLKVILAGAGPLDSHIRNRIKRHKLTNCIQMLGRIKDVDEVLIASDCLLLTSTLEGCPNVTLEAQHIGIPVVATKGGGTIDAVIDGKTGYLSGVSDAVGLTLAMRKILTDNTLRDRLGANGQRFVDQCFDIDQMVDLTASVYQLALQGNKDKQRIETPKPHLKESTSSIEVTPFHMEQTAISMPATPDAEIHIRSATTQKVQTRKDS